MVQQHTLDHGVIAVVQSEHWDPGYRWRTDESSDTMPYSYHGYAYALSNPVLLTDPRGTCAEKGNGDDYCRPGADQSSNYRDLTLWLYREMKNNLDDHRLQEIRALNLASITPGITVFKCGPVTLLLPVDFDTPLGLAQLDAKAKFENLFADRKVWDFKHKILTTLG